MTKPGSEPAASIAELQKLYDRLKEEKVRTEEKLRTAEATLEKLRAEAQAEFGTSELEALEKLLADQQAENERLSREYAIHLKTIQTDLARIEAESGS